METGLSLEKHGVSLREEKYAKTKIAILNVILEKLKDSAIEDINIPPVCREIGISKRTFFNYYPSKHYVIFYLLQIWIAEITIKVKSTKRKRRKWD